MMKKRLFTPGPVSMYPAALTAALEANIHHRTPEFKEILGDVTNKLADLLGNPEHVFLFASSGTGAMEAAVTNFFSPGEEVLVACCGKFGERWLELTERFELKTRVLRYDNGEGVRPEDVEKELRENQGIAGVFVQACESSTGVQMDVEALGRVVHSTDALLVVDAISAFATMPLFMEMGIDVLIGGSQKALMIAPGLAFLAIGKRAWERAESSHAPRYYFDVRSARKAWEKGGQTPFTPATSLILSLQSSLYMIASIGLKRLIELTENRARATRAALQAMGMELLAKKSPANALTAVLPAEGTAEKITSGLKKRFGIHLAGGQGDMKGKIFRISHMGFLDHFDTLAVLSALEILQKEWGVIDRLGVSLEAFQNVYIEVA